MERQESRHLAAREAQPGNRPLRADQSRTTAAQSYLEEAREARGAARQLGSGQTTRCHFLISNFPGL